MPFKQYLEETNELVGVGYTGQEGDLAIAKEKDLSTCTKANSRGLRDKIVTGATMFWQSLQETNRLIGIGFTGQAGDNTIA